MRKYTIPAVAVAAATAALVVGAFGPTGHTAYAALAVAPTGYAAPDPDPRDDNWGTGDLDERTVPPVLGPEHATGGPKNYDD